MKMLSASFSSHFASHWCYCFRLLNMFSVIYGAYELAPKNIIISIYLRLFSLQHGCDEFWSRLPHLNGAFGRFYEDTWTHT